MVTFAEARAATALGGVVPQLFALVGSVAAWMVLVGLLSTAAPTTLLTAVLSWLGSPVPALVASVHTWLVERSAEVTAAVQVLVVLAMLWSAVHLAAKPNDVPTVGGH